MSTIKLNKKMHKANLEKTAKKRAQRIAQYRRWLDILTRYERKRRTILTIIDDLEDRKAQARMQRDTELMVYAAEALPKWRDSLLNIDLDINAVRRELQAIEAGVLFPD